MRHEKEDMSWDRKDLFAQKVYMHTMKLSSRYSSRDLSKCLFTYFFSFGCRETDAPSCSLHYGRF